MKRIWFLVLVLSLALAACGEATAETASTPTTSTASTTSPSTTSTTEPPAVEIVGAPTDLEALVEALYLGEATSGLRALDSALVTADEDLTGRAAVASWGDASVAVVEIEEDVLGAVDDGSGWRIVAGTVDGTSVYPSLPAVFLVVGSDARPGEDRDRTRADSLHLVGLPGDGSASIVGIPRDWYVSIPGRGSNRINASLSLGGPDLMMETFESATGIDLAGYTLTGFEGFEHMVSNVLAGFELDVPIAFSDKAAKANFPTAGPQGVDGRAALSFARTRKAFAGGDFTRQLHGGLVLIGGAGAVKLRGPLGVPQLLEGSHEWMSTDMHAAELLELSLAVTDLDLLSISNMVVDGRAVTRNGASVVDLADSAYEVFADLADDARLEE